VALVLGWASGARGDRWHGRRVTEELIGAGGSLPGRRVPRVGAAPAGGRRLVTRTYMNESGRVLAAWRERHPLDLAELLVVVDDVTCRWGW
jgi:hypothetical protein